MTEVFLRERPKAAKKKSKQKPLSKRPGKLGSLRKVPKRVKQARCKKDDKVDFMIQNDDSDSASNERRGKRTKFGIRSEIRHYQRPKKFAGANKGKGSLEKRPFGRNAPKSKAKVKSQRESTRDLSGLDFLEQIEQQELTAFRKSIVTCKAEPKKGRKRQSLNSPQVKPQNYVKPEISYVGKIPDYTSFSPASKSSRTLQPVQALPGIQEEEPQPAKEVSQPRLPSRGPQTEELPGAEEYLGIFDILMKELSDVPNGIKEKLGELGPEMFEDKLVKIKKKRDRKKLSFEQQIKKLNVCTYNCAEQGLWFDLGRGEVTSGRLDRAVFEGRNEE